MAQRETAWLIEFETGNNWFSPGWRDEKRLGGVVPTWHWISPDVNQAVRFSRKDDAERVILSLRKFNTTFFDRSKFIATEHVWVPLHEGSTPSGEK